MAVPEAIGYVVPQVREVGNAIEERCVEQAEDTLIIGAGPAVQESYDED